MNDVHVLPCRASRTEENGMDEAQQVRFNLGDRVLTPHGRGVVMRSGYGGMVTVLPDGDSKQSVYAESELDLVTSVPVSIDELRARMARVKDKEAGRFEKQDALFRGSWISVEHELGLLEVGKSPAGELTIISDGEILAQLTPEDATQLVHLLHVLFA